MTIPSLSKIAELTDELLANHEHQDLGDNGIVVSMVPGCAPILGEEGWLAPVRHFLPRHESEYFRDLIPEGWEGWAESHYPFDVEVWGEWF